MEAVATLSIPRFLWERIKRRARERWGELLCMVAAQGFFLAHIATEPGNIPANTLLPYLVFWVLMVVILVGTILLANDPTETQPHGEDWVCIKLEPLPVVRGVAAYVLVGFVSVMLVALGLSQGKAWVYFVLIGITLIMLTVGTIKINSGPPRRRLRYLTAMELDAVRDRVDFSLPFKENVRRVQAYTGSDTKKCRDMVKSLLGIAPTTICR